MDKVLSAIWDKMEFGFDVVLPFVAVWAIIKYFREVRVKSINDVVRSSLVGELNSLVSKISNDFVYDVVEKCQLVEKKIDSDLEDFDLNSLGLESISIDDVPDGVFPEVPLPINDDDLKSLAKKSLDRAESARQSIDNFINQCFSSRYTIFPLMRALRVKEYIWKYESEVEDILEIHNELVDTIGIITALSFVAFGIQGIEGNRDIPEEMREKIKEVMELRMQGGEMAGLLSEGKAKVAIAVFLKLLSGEIQKARIECKEICVTFSAMLELIVHKNYDEFENILSEYKGLIFQVNRKIR